MKRGNLNNADRLIVQHHPASDTSLRSSSTRHHTSLARRQPVSVAAAAQGPTTTPLIELEKTHLILDHRPSPSPHRGPCQHNDDLLRALLLCSAVCSACIALAVARAPTSSTRHPPPRRDCLTHHKRLHLPPAASTPATHECPSHPLSVAAVFEYLRLPRCCRAARAGRP